MSQTVEGIQTDTLNSEFLMYCHSKIWFLKEISSVHQGCIYLIKNTVNIVKY